MIFDDVGDTESLKASRSVPQGTTEEDARMLERELGYFIPKCRHGAVLFTTNRQGILENLTGKDALNHVPVNGMNADSCIQLITQRLNSPAKPLQDTTKTDKLVAELVAKLHGNPLALVQAASYLNSTSTSTCDYLESLKEFESRVRSIDKQSPLEQELPTAVAITILISITKVRQQCTTTGLLLALMSFLDSQRIPKGLLRLLLGSIQEANEVPRQVQLEESLRLLRGLDIVQEETTDSIGIRSSVQLVSRLFLKDNVADAQQVKEFLPVITSHFPTPCERDNFPA